MIIVAKCINGIALNGYEYLLDEDSLHVLEFETKKAAVNYLIAKECTLAEIDSLEFLEIPN